MTSFVHSAKEIIIVRLSVFAKTQNGVKCFINLPILDLSKDFIFIVKVNKKLSITQKLVIYIIKANEPGLKYSFKKKFYYILEDGMFKIKARSKNSKLYCWNGVQIENDVKKEELFINKIKLTVKSVKGSLSDSFIKLTGSIFRKKSFSKKKINKFMESQEFDENEGNHFNSAKYIAHN